MNSLPGYQQPGFFAACMKNLLLLFLLSSPAALAQVNLPTNETGQVQYQEIVRLPDGTRPARQVYEQIRAWAGQHYPSTGEAERQHDDVHGIVFVRSLYAIGNQNVRYTLTVEARIGRYRATLTDLIAEGNGLTLPVRAVSPTAEELKKAADSTVKSDTLINQIATDQTDFYRQLDKDCRATLANLKETLTKED